MYDGVLYPRYKTHNYTSLDSSRKSKIFEGYDPKKNFRWQENCFSFCCLLMFFSSLEQLKRVDEKINFEIILMFGNIIVTCSV